jgi:hypothetical protein
MPGSTLLSIAQINTLEDFGCVHYTHDGRDTVTLSLRPEMWHGQMTHAYLVVWDDCKVPMFVVGNTIRKLVK